MKQFLLAFLLNAFCAHAFAATFFPEKGTPLTPSQIANFQGTETGNLLLIGDMWFEIDQLILGGLERNLWPNGVLVYEFDPNVTPANQTLFLNACARWHTAAPTVDCRLRAGETDFVHVIEHRGGNPQLCGGYANVSCSLVGKSRNGGQQLLAVFNSHWTNSRVLDHEIGHAFGLIHEQSRTDRDTFVQVKYQNIQQGQADQFDIMSASVPYTDYDYVSVMHYRNCDFSTHIGCTPTTPDLQTIVPWPCHIDLVGGTQITTLDGDAVDGAYAPSIQGLYSKSRLYTCGVLDLHPSQVATVCGANCGDVGVLTHNKVQHVYEVICGGIGVPNNPPDYYEKKYCNPLNKDLATYRWDSTGFGCDIIKTKHSVLNYAA